MPTMALQAAIGPAVTVRELAKSDGTQRINHRGSITLRALTWKSSNSPAHAHWRWSRLFCAPLTHITSVPECTVSSLGFLWGAAAVSRSCGISVGLARSPRRVWLTRTRHPVPRLPGADDYSPA